MRAAREDPALPGRFPAAAGGYHEGMDSPRPERQGMPPLIGIPNVTKGGHAHARVGAYAPASGAGGRMPGALCAPGGANPDRGYIP